MTRWPYALTSYSPNEVQLYCVQDSVWQQFRQSLKGLTTERKLDKLFIWRDSCLLHGDRESNHRNQVQVSNYINALKRGGLLNMNLEVNKGRNP